MNEVAIDVTGPLTGIGEVVKGLAAKNQTMKDGKPEGGGGGGVGDTRTRDPQGSYDKYKQKIRDAWSRHTGPDGQVMDPTALGLEIGQAVSDLAMAEGGNVLRLFGELAGKLRGGN